VENALIYWEFFSFVETVLEWAKIWWS